MWKHRNQCIKNSGKSKITCTHERNLNSHFDNISQPCLPSLESIYLHTYSIFPMRLICHVCSSLCSVDCSSFCSAVHVSHSFSLPLSPSFFLSPVACLPSLHLFTNTGGRKEGSMQTFGLSYPPYTQSASAPQEAACSTRTHRFQSYAHSSRMARKLDWHLNNRINGAYGLGVNTVTM